MSRRSIGAAASIATVAAVGGLLGTATRASSAPAARAAVDGCAGHPSDPSVVCTREGGRIVDVCDRDADGHQTYARVQTTGTYPGYLTNTVDENGSTAGCTNRRFDTPVVAVAVCVPYEGCGGFRQINPPPAAPVPPPAAAPAPPPAPPGGPRPNGSPATRLAKLDVRHLSTRSTERRVRFTTALTITGRLTTSEGAPIASAVLAVLARPRQAGARFFGVATVTTGADGSFRYRFGGGPSRTLRVAYSAASGDPAPAAVDSVRTAVRASVSAGVRPRSPRVGGRIRVTGRLLRLGRPGVQVNIQARDGRTWRTIGQTRTRGRAGRFTWRYRFRRTAAGRTVRLRARVNSPVYPFAAGASRSVRVRVRR